MIVMGSWWSFWRRWIALPLRIPPCLNLELFLPWYDFAGRRGLYCGVVSRSRGKLSGRRWKRQVLSSIENCFSFIRQSEALTRREHLARVAQLSSVLVTPRGGNTYTDVEISFSGVAVSHEVLTSAILAVQSYVSFPTFNSGALLTKDSLDDLKVNLPNGKSFTGDATFSPWTSLYCDCVEQALEITILLRCVFLGTDGRLASLHGNSIQTASCVLRGFRCFSSSWRCSGRFARWFQ